MDTFVYMVRHGDSPKEGEEIERGLTKKGREDDQRIRNVLEDEEMDVVISSPYKRSILTVEPLANMLGKEVIIMEDLKERVFVGHNNRLPDSELYPLLEKSFADPSFSILGGESNNDCQARAIKAFKDILLTYKGKKIVIGTHGAVMTLTINYFNSVYDLDFLLKSTKPDIYRLQFKGEQLIDVSRMWE